MRNNTIGYFVFNILRVIAISYFQTIAIVKKPKISHHHPLLIPRIHLTSLKPAQNMTSIGASTTHKVKRSGASKTPPSKSPMTKSPAMSRNSSSSSLYSLGGMKKSSKRPSSNNLADQVRGVASQLESITLKTEAQLAGVKLMDAAEATALMKVRGSSKNRRSSWKGQRKMCR